MTSTQPTTEYVVIGNGYFGIGDDVKEAKANYSKFGGHLSDGYTIFEFGPAIEFVGITGFGAVQWKTRDGSDYQPENPDHQPVTKEVKPRKVSR